MTEEKQTIEKNKVVTFFYRLSDTNGRVTEDNFKQTPMAYLHGHGNLFPALEKAIEGLSEGDEKSITLSANEAYGPKKSGATKKVPIKHLLGKHKKLLPGMLVKINTEQGAVDGSVIKAGRFMVEVDFNHPLAGVDVVFDVKITELRDATSEELSHGHAHGVGGHHH